MDNVKIALDTLAVSPGKSGAVGVFRNVLYWGPQCADSIEFIAFVSPSQRAYYEKFLSSEGGNERVHFRVFVYPEGNRIARLWVQHVLIPRECHRFGAAIHFTLNPEPLLRIKGVKEVYKMTGLQFYHVPDQLGRIETIYQGYLARRKARRADLIIANSQYTKRDVLEQIGVSEDRVRVVYEAVDHTIFYPEQDTSSHRWKLKQQFGIDFPYILNVSDLRPYKNQLALLNAYRILVERYDLPHRLVMVGSDIRGYRAVVEHAVHEAGLTHRVHIFNYIHHWDLVSFYHGAGVLVYPSELETFGTPPLEAMACGVPAIVSNATAMPEVSGGGAAVVDPHNAEQVAETIYKILSDDQYRDELIQKGLSWCKQYSWERNVQETVALLKEL